MPHTTMNVDLDELEARAVELFSSRYGAAEDAPPTVGFSLIARKRPGAPDAFEEARAFQGALASAGLAGLALPREYGGGGYPPAADAVVRRVASSYDIPNMIPLSVGLGLALPTLLGFATEATKQERIPRILDASEVWCQLFSEPAAGSDLASLRTSAVQEADRYVITGQKVWSSFAQRADFGLLLARTDPTSLGSKGITMFVLPMDTPGVEVRPLRDITGGAHFNEVFLDGVVVPAENVLGEVGGGWTVANATLGNERSLGRSLARAERPRWEQLRDLAHSVGRSEEPTVRQAIVSVYCADQIVSLTARRAAARAGAGTPGPETSIGKLSVVQVDKLVARVAMSIAGSSGIAWDHDDPEGNLWSHVLVGSCAMSIAGGSDEVQRNIVGEKVLGLPRELRQR